MPDTPPVTQPVDDSAPQGTSSRRQWTIVGVTATIVIVAVGSVLLLKHVVGEAPRARIEAGKTSVPGHFRPSAAQLARLKVTPVAAMTFRSERVTDGKIALNGDRSTPVFSPYSGRVSKVLANLGAQVKQGQPLLAIAATEFVQGQSDLISAVNALNTARAQTVLAQSNEQRKHALYDAKGGSLQDWQQSQSDLVAAQNNVRSAEAALALVRNRLRIQGKTDVEIKSLESPQAINADTYVLAPISGTVTDRQVGLGQYIQAAAANPVFVIGDLTTVWLIGNVREADAPLMRRGQQVQVRVLALPLRTFSAKLSYVAPSVDPNTRRLAVRAEVDNVDGALKPEMFATFSILTGAESTAPGVPERAVIYEGDTARVWVLEKDGTIALRPITSGRTTAGMVEVASGLSLGEEIVTSGALFIDRAGRGE